MNVVKFPIVCFCTLSWSLSSIADLTAEAFVNLLETRFTNGESAASIHASFATNGLYSFQEIMPICYSYTADTNNIPESIERYRRKIGFLEALRPKGPVIVSSNLLDRTRNRLWREEEILIQAIGERVAANPDDDYWMNLYPKATQMWSGPESIVFALNLSERFVKNELDFVVNVMNNRLVRFAFDEILNLGNYPITRPELYAELSTNRQYNADAMFRYCLTERADFATNNIAIAEKQIWRNNFVLEIVRHSCNLHTNAANRALDATYTDKLAAIRAHYDAIPEPHLGMAGAELDEWRNRLAATIAAYTNGVSPFAAH